MSQIKTVYVIKDMRTHGYYIRTDNMGATYWGVSPFIAKKFKSRKEAFDESCKLDNLVVIVDIAWKEGESK